MTRRHPEPVILQPGVHHRQCAGKVRYQRRKALEVALKLEKRDGQGMAAYECPYCSHWHVGHKGEDREKYRR